jgi:hypothetical protein
MKYIIAFFLFLTAITARADSINLAKGYQNNSNGTVSDQYAIKFTHDFNKVWDVDLLLANMKNRSTDSVTALYETGIRYKYPIVKKIIVYPRVALGSLQPSGADSKSYAGLELGIISKPFDNGIFIRFDHMFMTGINNDNMNNEFSRIWTGYDINQTTTIGIRRDFMRGDLNFDTWQLLYSVRW